MNTKKTNRKLKLNRETLRQLNDAELAAAQGGSALTIGASGGYQPPTKVHSGYTGCISDPSVDACTMKPPVHV